MEILGEKRSERDIFPSLEIARGPVVEQAETGNMIRRRPDRDSVAERIALPDPDAKLQLIVEPLRRTEARFAVGRSLGLPGEGGGSGWRRC